MTEKVAVILVNYESGGDLSSAILSLSTGKQAPDVYIVVDNASQDTSLKQATEKFPFLRVIRNSQNVGFSKAVNQGLREARRCQVSAVWLFNPDALAEKDTLLELLAVLKRHPTSLVSPIIFDEQGSVWFAGGRINWLRMRSTHAQSVISRTLDSDFLTGCALLIPMRAIEEVGFFDERFFLYYEDVDFSVRCVHAGFQLRIAKKSRVQHKEVSQNNPQKTYFLVLSGLLFFYKHATFLKRLYFGIYVTIRRLKNWLDNLLFGGKEALSVRNAYVCFWKNSRSEIFSHHR